MLIPIGDKVSIATMFNGELVTLMNSEDWYVWMKTIRDLSDNTISIFMRAMDRFWIWSLYHPIEVKEGFALYQGRYRDMLRSGYEITIRYKDEAFDDEVEFVVAKCDPLKKITINKEIAGINSYFYFNEESKLIDDHRFINYLYEKHRSAKGFLAGVEIKKSSLALEAFGKRVKYLPPYKVAKNRENIKYFPLELYDELLSIAQPRDRLIYLLCGACSARIGQALNLTMYDIDYDRQEVWLIDPKLEAPDIYGNRRSVWLKEEYGIDMQKANEHNTPDLQFKYPIPRYHEPLYWLNEEKYKKLFFETLVEYKKSKYFVSEFARHPQHPFLFVTKTGKRVHARDTLSRFKSNIRKLVQKHPEYKEKLSDLGLHSLRHLFGHYMAEVYARSADESIIMITMDAMGHSSMESTLIYFTISTDTKRSILQQHANALYGEQKVLT